MVTLKERPDTYSAGGIYLRDFRNDKSTGYNETPHKKVKGKKACPRKKPGCKGNNGKNHVYVWIAARYEQDLWGRLHDKVQGKAHYRSHPNYVREFYGYTPFDSQEDHIAWLEAREIQICAGCLKKSGKKRMKDNEQPDKSWWTWL